jgi:hypothetical protein
MWKPIIEKQGDIKGIRKLIREIVKTVNTERDLTTISLYENNIGIDLLNFYNHTIDRRTAVVTNDLVYYFTNLDIGKNSGLISGYTGLFWVINLLKKGSYLDLEEEELEVLQRLTYTNIEKSNVKGYDFFSGYLGQYLFLWIQII